MISYIPERETVEFRHYLITIKPYGVSKRVRKVFESAKSSTFLDLGKEKDVADFVLRRKGESDDGYESAASSASSVAGDDGDAVSLADDYVGRNNKRGQKRAIKLDEIGPRMELRLVKIMEGIPGKEGEVMYHRFGEPALCETLTFLTFDIPDFFFSLVKKSRAEIKSQKSAHAEKERLRKERREEQERNIARKKALQEGEEGDASDKGEGDEEDEEGEWDDEEEISEGDDSDADDDQSEGESEPEELRPPKRSKAKR